MGRDSLFNEGWEGYLGTKAVLDLCQKGGRTCSFKKRIKAFLLTQGGIIGGVVGGGKRKWPFSHAKRVYPSTRREGDT